MSYEEELDLKEKRNFEGNQEYKKNHKQEGDPECGSEHKYDDIINLPHHVSLRHPQMPSLDRAAQFSPFAALAGHDAAIRETARLAESRLERDGYSRQPFFEDKGAGF